MIFKYKREIRFARFITAWYLACDFLMFNKGFLDSHSRFHRGILRRIKRYLYDVWNVMDILSYILLISAFFVHHVHPSENFTAARYLFSLSLLVMYMRFLEVFLIHQKLGPTLIMIKEMVNSLKILLIMVSYWYMDVQTKWQYKKIGISMRITD